MGSLLLACALVASLGVPIVCSIKAVMAFDDNNPIVGYIYAGSALAVIVIGIALLIASDERSELCARGHETYQLVGKTMSRVWVCDDANH